MAQLPCIGVFMYIWLIFTATAGKHTIHGSYEDSNTSGAVAHLKITGQVGVHCHHLQSTKKLEGSIIFVQ